MKAQDYVGVQALHTTARLAKGRDIPDPQLHVHNVLIGGLDWAGRLRAIDTYPVAQFQAELYAQASADLAERLRQRGWRIERQLVRSSRGKVKRAAWEVAGVPPELVKAMSRRRGEVEELRDEYRQATGREPSGARWERFLEQHRGPKARRTSAEMYAAWAEEAAEYSFGPERVIAMEAEAAATRAAGVEKRDESSEAAVQLKREILADVCREHALVARRELDKLVIQRSMGLMHPYDAMGVAAEMFGDGDLLASTDGRVTTLEVLAAEQRATTAAAKLLEAQPSASPDRSELEKEFRLAEDEGRPFDDLQRRAIEPATSGSRLVSITGPAGTGKGQASRAMTAIWQRQGRRVIAAALTGRTARQAEADSGAAVSYTLEQLERQHEVGLLELQPSDVLFVDEAGVIDHHHYAPLLEAVDQAGATLVQVGDDKQLAAVGPGGLWTIIHGMAEARGQAAELEVIRRARNPEEARAWTDLREGRVEEALTWYRDKDRLRLYDTRLELQAGLVDDWWATPDRGVMVVDSSNEERDQLNRLAQERRIEASELGLEVLQLDNGREIRAGDRILFDAIFRPLPRASDMTLPARVENGTAATVVSVDLSTGTATLQLHEPKVDRERTEERVVQVPAAAPLELGYARHVYKAQGMTAEVADVATGSGTRHNELYTMVTRSREGTRIHALRAELEDMGAEPGNLELPLKPLQGAPSIDEWLRQPDLLAELRKREHERHAAQLEGPSHLFPAERLFLVRQRETEEATIREIAQQASRSSTKQAIGLGSWRQPEHERSASIAAISTRWHRLEQRDADAVPDASRAAWRANLNSTGSRSSLRDGSRAGVDESPLPRASRRRRSDLRPTPMPARNAMESIARAHASDGNIATVLAYYEVMGRLYAADDPAAEAARRWLIDRNAVIIVQTPAEEQRVRAVVKRLFDEAEATQVAASLEHTDEHEHGLTVPASHADSRAAHPPTRSADGHRSVEADRRESARGDEASASRLGSAPARAAEQGDLPSREPCVLRATSAYEERLTRRREWQRTAGVTRGEIVEPNVVERAYVVATDHYQHNDLTRALSSAAEAHLVSPKPDAWLQAHARSEAERIRAARTASIRAKTVRQAAMAAEMAERDRDLAREVDLARDGAPERDGAGVQ